MIYPILVKSKKGEVKFKLESGPEGMKMTKAGVIVWNVPPDYAGDEVNAIVTISDKTGQEIFHTFQLRVVSAPVVDVKK